MYVCMYVCKKDGQSTPEKQIERREHEAIKQCSYAHIRTVDPYRRPVEAQRLQQYFENEIVECDLGTVHCYNICRDLITACWTVWIGCCESNWIQNATHAVWL